MTQKVKELMRNLNEYSVSIKLIPVILTAQFVVLILVALR